MSLWFIEDNEKTCIQAAIIEYPRPTLAERFKS